MALTEKKRQALIKWLESMPWWEELPYSQFEKENVFCEECAFRYGAEHSNEDGTYTCPLCELSQLEKRIVALEANISKSVLRRLDAQLEGNDG